MRARAAWYDSTALCKSPAACKLKPSAVRAQDQVGSREEVACASEKMRVDVRKDVRMHQLQQVHYDSKKKRILQGQ